MLKHHLIYSWHMWHWKVKIHFANFKCCAGIRGRIQFRGRQTCVQLPASSLVRLVCYLLVLGQGLNNAYSKCTAWVLTE